MTEIKFAEITIAGDYTVEELNLAKMRYRAELEAINEYGLKNYGEAKIDIEKELENFTSKQWF